MPLERQLERPQAQRRLRLICSFCLYPHNKLGLHLSVSQGKVNRDQLIALDVGFPLMDSMYDFSYNLGNKLSLHRCLYELSNKSHVLGLALLAICLLRISNRTKKRHIEIESLILRNRALGALFILFRNAADATEVHATETLAAALCLKTYEELSSYLTSRRGKKNLRETCRLLIRHREPERNSELQSHVLFVRWFREDEVCYALGIEERTFLDSEWWYALPWRDIQKSDTDQMIDILTAYTHVREEVKLLSRARFSIEQVNSAKDLLRNCQQLDSELENWIEEFRSDMPGRDLYLGLIKIDHATQEYFFHRFEFTSMKVAMLLVRYWAIFILLHSSMARLEKFQERARTHLALGTQGRAVFTKKEHTYDMATSHMFALNICCSIRYLRRRGTEFTGSIYLAFPLMVAWRFLRSRTQKVDVTPIQQAELNCCDVALLENLELGLCLFDKQLGEDLV